MKTTQVCIKWRKQDGNYRKYRAKEVLSYFSSCFTLFTLLSCFFWNLHLNSAILIFLSVESIIPVSFLQKSRLVLRKFSVFLFQHLAHILSTWLGTLILQTCLRIQRYIITRLVGNF